MTTEFTRAEHAEIACSALYFKRGTHTEARCPIIAGPQAVTEGYAPACCPEHAQALAAEIKVRQAIARAEAAGSFGIKGNEPAEVKPSKLDNLTRQAAFIALGKVRVNRSAIRIDLPPAKRPGILTSGEAMRRTSAASRKAAAETHFWNGLR